ncbi:hypothetical protein D3C79_816520 [compost metagenome]
MDVLADHIGRLPSQHPRASRVDESGQAFAVDTVDTVTYRTEQQLVVALGFLEQVEDVAPLDQPSAHGTFGIRLVLMKTLATLLTQHKDDLLLPLDVQRGGRNLQLHALTSLAVTAQFVRPSAPLLQHGLTEHDEFGQLVTEQLADRQRQ